MTTPAARERWTLTFEPLPSEVPAAVRIRGLLKRALRSFGLKLVSMAEPKAEAPTDQADQTEDRDHDQ